MKDRHLSNAKSGMKKSARNNSVRRKDVVAVLREEIIRGVYKPGSVFPTRAELQQRFHTTPVTIQHAMDILRRDGFVYSSARRATYVSPSPPHLFRYAMVFTTPPASVEQPGARFFQTLITVASAFDGSQREPRKIVVQFSIEFEKESHETRAFLSSARAHCFAGLIFPQHPYVTGIADSPLCGIPGVPCAAIMDKPSDRIGAVMLDGDSLINKALDFFADRKRKRLAVISNISDPSFQAPVMAGARHRGLTIKPYWWQAVTNTTPQFAENIAHLMFSEDIKDRPDALFITDDNLADYALRGVVAAGIKVPYELEVVAHCNFPCGSPGILPVRRLGYDARTIIETCLKSIDQQRRGNPPGKHLVPAVFEEEVSLPAIPTDAGPMPQVSALSFSSTNSGKKPAPSP